MNNLAANKKLTTHVVYRTTQDIAARPDCTQQKLS